MATRNSPSQITLWLISWLAPAYLWLIKLTSNWHHVDRDKFTSLIKNNEPFILCFWHNRLMMMPFVKKEMGRDIMLLVSENKDGEYVTHATRRFGLSFARGSTMNPRKKEKNKSGAAGLKAMIKAVKSGANVGLTPDGPRGPRQRVQMGVVQLARLSDIPMMPVAWSTSRGKRLDSWDQFLLAAPFSKGCFVYGDPVWITDKSEKAIEAGRLAIEEELNRITAAADEFVGRHPIPAGDASTERLGKPDLPIQKATS